ncbi:MAG: T9SS type A sorting domain-containing protein [Bacteroidetes bacterium]|nr:T9SS type A sorting domain-containing protein [Bacteroidota bacterium]
MRLIFTLFTIAISGLALSQVAKDQVIALRASTDGDKLHLSWANPPGFAGSHTLYRMEKGGSNWEQLAVFTAGETGYTDEEATVGKAFDYQMVRTVGVNTTAMGFLYAGLLVPDISYMGGVIILVDSVFKDTLSNALATFRQDLESEGWQSTTIYAGRGEEVVVVKDRIVQAAKGIPNATALVIVGHVPVPYSGNFTLYGIVPPDGHVEGSGNHTGAWPADVYYGDLDGQWTDNTANHTDSKLDRNDNVPGDGKFDQTKLPSTVELEVGRIDFFDMPAFQLSEKELMINYFARNHAFRTGKWVVRQRALIDNNFTGFNLASTGYHTFSTLFEDDSVDVSADYLTAQREGSYLWSYGCGAGSFTSCNGLYNGAARTSDLAADTLRNVFTILAGSYFGDWDIRDNFLRAPLCNRSLVSFWGGLPKWYVHHMALGWHVGYGARLTQNNQSLYFNGGFNNSQNSTHIALIGDPTLKNKYLQRPSGLSATSNNGNVSLTWTDAPGLTSYNVYRVDADNRHVQLNGSPVEGTSFVDENNWNTGNYTYAVRSVVLEVNPSGSYYLVSGSVRATVDHINSVDNSMAQPLALHVRPNPTTGRIWVALEEGGVQQVNLVVVDLSGREVRTVHVRELSANQGFALDLENLHPGVYLLKVRGQDGQYAQHRIMKY